MKLPLVALFLSLALGLVVRTSAQTLPPVARLVMSHFKADGGGGDERLYISWSADGLDWTALNNGQPVWQPPGWEGFWNVVRDPTIIYHDGYYWVAYTSGNYGKGTTFGLVKSVDLLNWTFVIHVNAALPGATDQLTWSPIFFEDGDGSIHVIVAISPINGSIYHPVPGLRVHEMHPLNADWTQWSVPVPLALPNPNNNDCWVWKEGLTYHAAYADFDRGGGVVHATSTNLVTGWIERHYLGYRSQEGNLVLPKPDGGYRLYLEPGNGMLPEGFRTTDYTADFTNPTPQIAVTTTVPMRNGKVCAVRGVQSYEQWKSTQLASETAANQAPLADPEADGLPNLVEHLLATNPTAPTPLASQPRLTSRQIGANLYPSLVFDFLRSSKDVSVEVQTLLANEEWSSSPTDVVVESLTLMSDGTTRVQAHTAQPHAAGVSLLRIQSTLAPPAVQAQSISLVPTPAVRTATPRKASVRAKRR